MGQSTSQMGQGTLAHLRSHQHHHHHDHDVVDENTSLLDQARRESQNVRKRSSVVRSANLNEMGEENRTLAARHGGSMFRAVDYGQNSSRAENSVDDRSANPSAELPIYRTIHSIRRDVVRAIEDPYSLEQLRDPRMNVSVVRPLVDKCYQNQDVSMIYCLLVNRTQFLREQIASGHRQNVCVTRALLCEIVANRVLRRFVEDNPGPDGLLLLSQILVGSFDCFQGAPPDIAFENSQITWAMQTRNGKKKRSPALEIAIISESKIFLSSAGCQKVVNAIYEGRVVYTPTSFIDILPDHYKQKPIMLYDPRRAPLLNQYRMIVPRTRALLEVVQFVILLGLYLGVMYYGKKNELEYLEVIFIIFSLGWILDQTASVLEHGWSVYTQNLWSFLDVTFTLIFFIYFCIRIQGYRTTNYKLNQQSLDVLAMGAPILIPRLAFNLMSENMLFLSLRAMMRDFAVLTLLAIWSFMGFLLSMYWLSGGAHSAVTISKWMVWIWFGLDGTGIQRSTEFHQYLGPVLMVLFALLGNTLFLTILVSMLSTTFSKIDSNAQAEIMFRRAVLTFEGVKSDAIFAYQPPFNLGALVILLPLKFMVSSRWFHKINVAAQRTLNFPILLCIGFVERRVLWKGTYKKPKDVESPATHMSKNRSGLWDFSRGLSVHGDINRVFEALSPDEEEGEDDETDAIASEISSDLLDSSHEALVEPNSPEEQRKHDTNAFDRAFGIVATSSGLQTPKLARTNTGRSRRDSVIPWGGGRGAEEIGDEDGLSEEVERRLNGLERKIDGIEALLTKLVSLAEK